MRSPEFDPESEEVNVGVLPGTWLTSDGDTDSHRIEWRRHRTVADEERFPEHGLPAEKGVADDSATGGKGVRVAEPREQGEERPGHEGELRRSLVDAG